MAEWNCGGWVGSCRRVLRDHVIAVNEHHLRGRRCEYVCNYYEDRTDVAGKSKIARPMKVKQLYSDHPVDRRPEQ